MESSQFDALTRALANISSERRGLMYGALGGGLTTLLTWLGLGDAEAKNKNKKRKRKRRRKRKKRNKKCKGSRRRCRQKCADLLTDPNNCGACGAVSPTGECRHGAFACSGGDCPQGACFCQGLQGFAVCAGGTICTDDICASDGDCPLGSACVCVNSELQSTCSVPCSAG